MINPVAISFIIYTLSPQNYFVANIRQHMTSSLNISVYISKIIKLFENIKCCHHIYDNNALIYLQFTLVSIFLHILFESGYTRYKGVPHWNWWLWSLDIFKLMCFSFHYGLFLPWNLFTNPIVFYSLHSVSHYLMFLHLLQIL